MTPDEIVRAAMEDGVLVTLSPIGTIKAIGEQSAVNRWLSILQENKVDIVLHLSDTNDTMTPLPAWCRPDCSSLEVISGVGPGCVREMENGPWLEEWRRLDTMTTCPKRLH